MNEITFSSTFGKSFVHLQAQNISLYYSEVHGKTVLTIHDDDQGSVSRIWDALSRAGGQPVAYSLSGQEGYRVTWRVGSQDVWLLAQWPRCSESWCFYPASIGGKCQEHQEGRVF